MFFSLCLKVLFKKSPPATGHFPGQEKEEWKTKSSCFVTKAFSVYWKAINFMADTKILGVFTTVCAKQLTALTHMLSFSCLQDPLLVPGPWRGMQEKHTPEHSPAFLLIGKTTCRLARRQNLLVRKRRRSCCMEGVEWEVNRLHRCRRQRIAHNLTLKENKNQKTNNFPKWSKAKIKAETKKRCYCHPSHQGDAEAWFFAFINYQRQQRGRTVAGRKLQYSSGIRNIRKGVEQEQTVCQTVQVLRGFVSNSERRCWQSKPLF